MDSSDAENQPQPLARETELAEAWVLVAWKLWVDGLRNWTAIGKEVSKNRETVKKHVTRYGETIAELYTTRRPSVLGEYIDGLVNDLSFNVRVALAAERGMPISEAHPMGVEPDMKAAVSARREASARRRDIAEVLGLVGPLGGQMQTNILIGGHNGEGNGETGLSPSAIQFMLRREALDEDEFLALPRGTPPDIEAKPRDDDETD